MRALLLVALLTGCVGHKRQVRAAAHMELGAAYLEEHNPEDAIAELRQAVKEDPRSWGAWEKLGLAYMSRGATKEADDAFRHALRHAPDNAEVLNNYGLLLLGQNRVDEAIATLEHAREDLTYRKPALVLNNLGYAYLLAGNYDMAGKRLDEAIQRMPDLCPAHFHRGLVYKAQGQLDRAMTELDRVIERCGDEAPGAYYHAAEVLLAQGNRVAAETYLQNVLRLAHDDVNLTDAAKVLLAKAGD